MAHDAADRRTGEPLSPPGEPRYELTLFVSGASDLSARAIADARRVCDTHVAEPCALTVVDLHLDPHAGLRNGVVAAPTLVRSRPLPARKLVGDLSHPERVLRALDLPRATERHPEG